jgi:23S rRNA pseudouridine2605 synthase
MGNGLPNGESIRLHVFLARAGIASRRRCERFIEEGRVRVNGQPIRQQGVRVTASDMVTFDARPVRIHAGSVYVALNKPKRYLCSNHDPQGRPLAVDLLRPQYRRRLFSIGRLDYMSTGLILFTNDGDFARDVSHPSSEIEKEYLVDLRYPVEEELLKSFVSGVRVKGETYTVVRYRMKNPRSVALTLVEGKNREIRRVFEHWGLQIKRLKRIRVGIVTLKGLEPGDHRPLTPDEIEWFRSHASREG